MKGLRRVSPLRAAVVLAAATLGVAACSDDDATDEADNADAVLLDERFDDDSNGWGGGFQRIEDGKYVWELPAGQTDARAADTLIADADAIDAVVVTTVFTPEGAAHVGVDCAVADIDGQADFYQLLLTDQGPVIRKASFGDVPPVTLAEADEPTLADGTEVELAATCTLGDDGYTLALAVDGETVLEVVDADDPLGTGAPGIVAGAAPRDRAPDGAVIRFDSYTARNAESAS